MKFTTLREHIQNVFSIIQRIVVKNPSLPILENILLETEDKQLKISATNLELGIHIWTKGKVEKEGKVSVPALLLGNVINNVKEERVILEGKGVDMEVNAEHFHSVIKGQDANDFPIIPKPDIKNFFEIEVKKFREALSQVSYVATISEVYPEISGVYFSFAKDILLLAATDSFRLGKKELNEHIPKEFIDSSFILPLRSSQELLSILEQITEGRVRIGRNENQAVFFLQDIYLVSRLLSGTYPNYSQLIPKNFTTTVLVNRQEFIDTIKLISVFSPKTYDCKIEIGGSELKLSSNAAYGSSEASLRARVEGVGDPEIIFNYHYLLDGLLHIPAKEIIFHVKNKATPVLFQGVGDQSYMYLIAPLKG